ncbi:uncharacterized protein EV154DRAFT_500991 [Mucor mucedo]|uniref:uncharacterized protein n=1 Tax=Mucor mucedo TaxID=29922 RepID=UPI00221EA0E1|nr:uncharacterized protein EV154DRAFT_500991 [Mucor mucedo]KAI7893613.1 hypothetical protein EV154DRAFT_500991 [Mucor mucedo]
MRMIICFLRYLSLIVVSNSSNIFVDGCQLDHSVLLVTASAYTIDNHSFEKQMKLVACNCKALLNRGMSIDIVAPYLKLFDLRAVCFRGVILIFKHSFFHGLYLNHFGALICR